MSQTQETTVETFASSMLQPTLSPERTTPAVPVSIVSDSRLLRDGLCTLLKKHVAVTQIGSYDVTGHPPGIPMNPPGHLVLVDGSADADRVVGWTRYWNDTVPPASVVVVEIASDPELIVTCIEAGASAYTARGAGLEDVAMAVRQARSGMRPLQDEIVAVAVRRLRSLRSVSTPPSAPGHSLSPREVDVLHCLARGKSNREIAEHLYIELCTVKHHVHHILEKLQVRHRWDAVRLAQDHGWV